MVTVAMKLKDVCSLEESYDKPRQCIKSRDITLPTKVYLLKAKVFPGVMCGSESWTIDKSLAIKTYSSKILFLAVPSSLLMSLLFKLAHSSHFTSGSTEWSALISDMILSPSASFVFYLLHFLILKFTFSFSLYHQFLC